MCRNAGGNDRIARTILGLCLVYAGIIFHDQAGCAMPIIGLILLFSGLTGWCPLYALFGVSSRCASAAEASDCCAAGSK